MSALRKWLLSGLLVLVPLGITFWLVNWVVSTLDLTLSLLPPDWRPAAWLGLDIPGLGVVFALLIVLLIGGLTSNFIGKAVLHWWHGLLGRIPVVRSIYSAVKQVSDTVFSEKGNAFREAVLVQWPREGAWTIAFVTAAPSAALRPAIDADDFYCVYVPTTPNPTSGYLMFVRKSECRPLDLSVDAALTHVISMGVLDPAAKTKPTSPNSIAPRR